MADESPAQKVDHGLVVAIVRSYVAKNEIAADQLGDLIATVHRTLGGLGTNVVPASLTPVVPIGRSVQQHHVVCLECGFPGQTLRRQLRVWHGLDVAAYRARWKLAGDHPLTAPVYSERRSALAQQLGFGRRPRSSASDPPSPAVPARSSATTGRGLMPKHCRRRTPCDDPRPAG